MARSLGVLLAGGRGRRLSGSGPKALARLAGVTLLERAASTLSAVCDERVIVAPRALGLPVPDGWRVAHDDGRGPLQAVVAGLGAVPYERALVLGVDFPLIDADTLCAIADRLGDAPAVAPRPDEHLQPLVAAYAPRACAALAALIERGERSLIAAVLAIGARVIEGEELAALPGGLERFLNVNTPAELDEAERRLSAMERR
jgi:molybdopterin-guanine dinucleotide biosynthesis protein A